MPNANLDGSLSGVSRIGKSRALDWEGAGSTPSVPASTHPPAEHVNKCMLLLLVICLSIAIAAVGMVASATRSALTSGEAVVKSVLPEQS
jgi:hypothetical protein